MCRSCVIDIEGRKRTRRGIKKNGRGGAQAGITAEPKELEPKET